MPRENTWYVYMLECEDSSLYTGVTTDVKRRFEKHKLGEGAKYTKAHRAKKLVYAEMCESKSKAYKRETEIKHLSRKEKLALVQKI